MTLPEPLVRLGARHPLAIAAIIVATVIGVGATIATVAAFAAERWWVLDVLTSFRPSSWCSRSSLALPSPCYAAPAWRS